MLGLDFVLNSTNGKLVSGGNGISFSGVSTDSRNITSGEIFFALKGENYDGHEYVEEAIKKARAARSSKRTPSRMKPGNYLSVSLPHSGRSATSLRSGERAFLN